MAEIEKELRHYLEGSVEPCEALEWSRETSAAMVDLKFCDLLGTWQQIVLCDFDDRARSRRLVVQLLGSEFRDLPVMKLTLAALASVAATRAARPAQVT